MNKNGTKLIYKNNIVTLTRIAKNIGMQRS